MVKEGVVAESASGPLYQKMGVKHARHIWKSISSLSKSKNRAQTFQLYLPLEENVLKIAVRSSKLCMHACSKEIIKVRISLLLAKIA